MASGFGLTGGKLCPQFPRIVLHATQLGLELTANLGVSRCFPFWQEYLACYVVNQTEDSDPKNAICAPALEDYYECLHHRKEVT